MAYVYFSNNPKRRDDMDCVIRAISCVTGLEWQDVYVDLCSIGLMEGEWGNSNHVWGKFLRELGYHRQMIPNMCPDCYTVKDFCRDHQHGDYILATGNHVVAVIDGDYWDAFDSGNLVPQFYYTK